MSVRYALLGLLSRNEMHGYELKTSFDRVIGGFWQLNFGQIYSTLDRLERDGLVERSVERDEAADKKVYRITTRGRTELDAWLVEPVAQPRALRDDLFVKLLFTDPTETDSTLRMIDRHRDVYEIEARKLTKRKAEIDRMGVEAGAVVTDLLIDAALFHAEAELKWLSHVAQKLRKPPREPRKRTPGSRQGNK